MEVPAGEGEQPTGGRSSRPRRRRWPLAVGAVVTVVAMLAAAVWFVWLPRYRPTRHTGERYGIDVSGHQGRIDWPRVARDGISFAYIKATEDGDFVDRDFADNWTAAGNTSIERGAYHFFTLCTPGGAQAQNVLDTVEYVPDALPPAVDLELVGNCHARPDRGTVLTRLNDFLAAVEAVTHKPTVLYLGHDFEHRYKVRYVLHRPLWNFASFFGPGTTGPSGRSTASPTSTVSPAASTSTSRDDRP